MDHCRKTILFLILIPLLAACAIPAPVPAPTATPLPTATMTPTATPEPVLPQVTVERYEFYSQFFSPYVRRVVDIFLPPGYAESDARYKVLYAQDGQDMADVRLRAALEQLYAEDAIDPIIVVAIHAEDRMYQYGTAGIPDYQARGSRADLYTRLLLEELIPYLNTNYRTQTGPENTTVMGWSLGGLMAFDLAWNHPDVFGRVGVFSGSFWWHTDDTDLASMLGSRIVHNMVRDGGKRDGMQFWFESGFKDEEDDRDGDGVIDAVQDTRELVAELKAVGYSDDAIRLVELPDGYHGPGTWAGILPDFLCWAYGK